MPYAGFLSKFRNINIFSLISWISAMNSVCHAWNRGNMISTFAFWGWAQCQCIMYKPKTCHHEVLNWSLLVHFLAIKMCNLFLMKQLIWQSNFPKFPSSLRLGFGCFEQLKPKHLSCCIKHNGIWKHNGITRLCIKPGFQYQMPTGRTFQKWYGIWIL